MALRALTACLVAGVALLVACGGGGNTADDGAAVGAAAPSNPSANLDRSGTQCSSDADCPAGFTCTGVALGEFVQRSCTSSDASAPPPGTNVAIPDAGSNATTGDAAPDANYACSKALSATITTVAPNPRPKCFLNTTVDTSSPAVLGYVCEGGSASVTFGAQTFNGSESGGVVSVTNSSTYSLTSPYLGGVTCKIDALQKITGTLASGTLQYNYTETFTAGQSSICPLAFQLCNASGPVAVQ